MTDKLTFYEETAQMGGFIAGIVFYVLIIVALLFVIAFVFGEH